MRFFKNSVKVYTCVSRILSQTRYKVLNNCAIKHASKNYSTQYHKCAVQ